MTKQAAAVLALGIAGAIITCAFVLAFYEMRGILWLIAALVTAYYTLTKLWETANSVPAAPAVCTTKGS